MGCSQVQFYGYLFRYFCSAERDTQRNVSRWFWIIHETHFIVAASTGSLPDFCLACSTRSPGRCPYHDTAYRLRRHHFCMGFAVLRFHCGRGCKGKIGRNWLPMAICVSRFSAYCPQLGHLDVTPSDLVSHKRCYPKDVEYKICQGFRYFLQLTVVYQIDSTIQYISNVLHGGYHSCTI